MRRRYEAEGWGLYAAVTFGALALVFVISVKIAWLVTHRRFPHGSGEVWNWFFGL